jgi:hypothetical protein
LGGRLQAVGLPITSAKRLHSCRSNDNLDLPKADTAYVAAEPQPITLVYMFESCAVRQTPPIAAQIGQLSA